MWWIVFYFFCFWFLSLFSQSFFNHRYAAHSQFKMTPRWEKFFFIFSWLTMGSSYLSPKTYGILHRIHHAYADTEKDVHSPRYDNDIISMMSRTREAYSGIGKGSFPVEERFKKNLPTWDAFDAFAESYYMRLAWGIAYFIFYVIVSPYPLISLGWFPYITPPLEWLYILPFWAFTCAMGPIHGAIVNWFAHLVGYRNFDTPDTSRNFLPFDFLMLGESYHNNHHQRPGNANFGGVRWHEKDPIYWIIRGLDYVNIVQLPKTAST
ncbi:MAG: acyl-CoA desaturase [bacterium]|nr:acyl-CoA desaturase [bacterium]